VSLNRPGQRGPSCIVASIWHWMRLYQGILGMALYSTAALSRPPRTAELGGVTAVGLMVAMGMQMLPSLLHFAAQWHCARFVYQCCQSPVNSLCSTAVEQADL
jgi:hypothetical protein